MRNFISFLTIILCCLTVTPMHGRKKDKQTDKEEVVLAMVEPDMMATPSHSHPIVAPVEEAYRHRINKNEHRYGIDVSRYQGDIDWQTVKTDKNVSYVYLKATVFIRSLKAADWYTSPSLRKYFLPFIP